MSALDLFLPMPEAEELSPTAALLASAGVKRLSPSSIDSFWKCAERWRREKLIYESFATTPKQIFGSAFHRAAAVNFEQKIASDEDLPDAEMRDLTGDAFNETVESEKGEHEIVWNTTKPNDLQQEVILAMTGTDSAPGYHQTLAPSVHPVATERWAEEKLPSGIPLVGRIDIETREQGVWDIKTSAKAMAENALLGSTQARAYSWLRAQEGTPAESFGYHVVIKTKTPRTQELSISCGEAELSAFEKHAQMTVEAIEAMILRYGVEGPWPQAPANAWWCSATQCSFWASCPWRGGAS